MPKKILFICLHRPGRTPSQRFRFEQYVNFLNDSGFACSHKYLLNEKDDRIYYSKGQFIQKARILLQSFFFLLRESSKKTYDIVFVQREAFMLGTAFFEKRFAKRSKLVFDLDDSIWMHQVGETKSKNRSLYFLKNPDKIKEIIRSSDLIFAGNQYLANYVQNFNSNVVIVPTTIDTERYRPQLKKTETPICIGWSGSFSTVMYFDQLVPTLEIIKSKYGERISFKVIGDADYEVESLNLKGIAWNEKTEIEDLSEIDIGIMPLSDDDWTRGKCGLKGLQYMALEIPTIMSPVGVNTAIIQDGENGFLADTSDEWIQKLSFLIEDENRRKSIGIEGRRTVVESYSVEANKHLYKNYLSNLLAKYNSS